MVVKSREELIRLIYDEGWVLYYHAGIKRWCLRRGRERMLVDKNLNDVAEELARGEGSQSPEVVSSQPVFNVVIPVEYDPVYDPSNVMRRMEDVWVSSIPVLPPPFPPVRPPRFFRRRVGVKCQRCGFVLSVEVPDDLPSVKEVMCKNCMALIRVHFKWG